MSIDEVVVEGAKLSGFGGFFFFESENFLVLIGLLHFLFEFGNAYIDGGSFGEHFDAASEGAVEVIVEDFVAFTLKCDKFRAIRVDRKKPSIDKSFGQTEHFTHFIVGSNYPLFGG